VRSYPPVCLESAGVVSGVPSSLCLDPANRSASRYEAQLPYKSFEKPGFFQPPVEEQQSGLVNSWRETGDSPHTIGL